MNRKNWLEISAEFQAAVAHRWRPEISLEPAPAPARLATHTAAVLADVLDGENPIGDGRLVLLYENSYQVEWDGHLRLVGFTRADLETELVTDPLLLEVGWSWVLDSFKDRGLSPLALSGTVSRSGNQSFGDISGRAPSGAIEIRSSWTVPDIESVADHVGAWADLLSSAAGLLPLPKGVGVLPRRRA